MHNFEDDHSMYHFKMVCLGGWRALGLRRVLLVGLPENILL